jgi:hypothetical protein
MLKVCWVFFIRLLTMFISQFLYNQTRHIVFLMLLISGISWAQTPIKRKSTNAAQQTTPQQPVVQQPGQQQPVVQQLGQQQPVVQQLAQAQPVVQQSAPVQALPQQVANDSRPNSITLAAAQQGVLTCSGRINQIVNFLGVDDKAGALLMLPPSQQDQRLVPLSLEIPLSPTGNSAYVTATFAPNLANGCGAGYESVIYWPKTCEDVFKQSFGVLKPMGTLKQNIYVLDGGSQLKVFLMPAGQAGCVSIKREVLL